MFLQKNKKKLIPWAWAVNGSASVLSPYLAVLIALYTGYSSVFVFAGFKIKIIPTK